METEIRGTEERQTGCHLQLYRQHTIDRHPALFEPAIPPSEWTHNDVDGHWVLLMQFALEKFCEIGNSSKT
jgi:hypothetical protein